MLDVVAEFRKVLDSERAFALRADVDGLAAIQEEKRALLQQLLASGAPEAETAKLKQQALSNVQLIRHLVACLQGLSSPPAATYTAGGGRPSGAMSRSWGRL
jgi:anti-sigma factor RsiW